MSFAERLQGTATEATRIAPTRKAPTGFEPGVKYEGGAPAEITLALREIPADEQEWRDEIKRVTTLTIPDDRRVEIAQVRYWGDPKQPMVYVRFAITDRPVDTATDLAELVKVARNNRRPRTKSAPTNRTRVVVLSDAQIGKVDARGGTPQLLERIDYLLAAIDGVARETPCDDVVILDPGDLTEGFENTAQQAHTNDLSFPEQLRYARVILTEAVTRIAARHPGGTRVATVPSNHTQWRRGKDRLGRPGDDFGIETHRAVADALALAGRDDIATILPGPWDESLALTVRGAVIGLAHGHQVSRPEGIPAWWAKQTHGGGPLAAASILITGHFHHPHVTPSGAIDGRARWWMQAPTMDNGSSWWANGSGGADCEAGVLTFTVDDAGRWDHLRILTHEAAA